jgi:uncharacterized membrane protein
LPKKQDVQDIKVWTKEDFILHFATENQNGLSFGKGNNFQFVQDAREYTLAILLFLYLCLMFLHLIFGGHLHLMLPTYIDGLTQAFFKRESNNILRVTTGLMAGIGGMSLVAIIGKYIGDQILLIFK